MTHRINFSNNDSIHGRNQSERFYTFLFTQKAQKVQEASQMKQVFVCVCVFVFVCEICIYM